MKNRLYKDVRPKDIYVFRNFLGDWSHVEIITSIQNNWIADDGFCSIGTGRGYSHNDNKRKGDGKEKCDSHGGLFGIPYLGGSRELKDNDNTYYHL